MRTVSVKEVRGGSLEVSNVSACFRSEDGPDLVVHGTVVLPPVLTHNCEREVEFLKTVHDDPANGSPELERDLTVAEELLAAEALFQAAIDGARAA